MKDKINSIQIIGTQRSGSNLLRLMLNQFDEISAPHPPHVLRTFEPLLKHYGDLSIKDNFYLLATDIADFVNANPVSWSGDQFNGAELAAKAKHNSLLSLYETLYIFKARQDNARIWCCKSMFNEYYAREIEDKGLKPFYIYMFRDGRDVAASFKKAIVGPKHIFHIATKWREDQEKALQVQSFIDKNRFFRIRYEDLITKPEEVLRALSDKLGLEYSARLLEYYESTESRHTASAGEMWKNVAKPIIRNNVGKFKHELEDEEIAIFENITGQMLSLLGYPLTTNQKLPAEEYSPEQIDQFNKNNAILQKEVWENALQHDLELRSRQKDIVKRIKLKFGLIIK